MLENDVFIVDLNTLATVLTSTEIAQLSSREDALLEVASHVEEVAEEMGIEGIGVDVHSGYHIGHFTESWEKEYDMHSLFQEALIYQADTIRNRIFAQA